METIVDFLFGEQYGGYLMDSNIAFFMVAGFVGIILLVVILAVVLSSRGNRLEKIGGMKDGQPIDSSGLVPEDMSGIFPDRNKPILPDDPGGLMDSSSEGSFIVGDDPAKPVFEKIPFGTEDSPKPEPQKDQEAKADEPEKPKPAVQAKKGGSKPSDAPKKAAPPKPKPVPKKEAKTKPPVDEKPGMIPNPLPVPPEKEKTGMDYDLDVSEEDDYDI